MLKKLSICLFENIVHRKCHYPQEIRAVMKSWNLSVYKIKKSPWSNDFYLLRTVIQSFQNIALRKRLSLDKRRDGSDGLFLGHFIRWWCIFLWLKVWGSVLTLTKWKRNVLPINSCSFESGAVLQRVLSACDVLNSYRIFVSLGLLRSRLSSAVSYFTKRVECLHIVRNKKVFLGF